VGWLSTHEYIAIWLEGIALVAIFIWDRLDARADHRQTMAQLKIAQEQAAAAQASAQSVINAEREWVVPGLRANARRFADGRWYHPHGGELSTEDVMAGKHQWYWITLTNMGRTPAQILGIVIRYSCLGKGVTGLPKDAAGDHASYREFHHLLGADGQSVEISERIDLSLHMRDDLDAINKLDKTAVIHGWIKYRHMFSTSDDCYADFCYVYTASQQRLTTVGRHTKQRQQKAVEILEES
jgi:hypothetical protein